MDRHLLLFSDGTGNSSGKLLRTNVWRTYEAVDLEDPQNPAHPRQFAYYDNGVGTSAFKPLAILGGAFGVGLARNVRDLYAFVCRTYRPGDKIYVFGFSRGAFTVRVLVGLMMNQGLVPYNGSEAELRRNVAAAYRAYRWRWSSRAGWWLVQPIRRLRDSVIDLRNAVLRYAPYDSLAMIGRETSSNPLHVEFLGVWDTVAAYGLPVDELTRAIDQYIWPLSMPDRDLSPRVRRAMQALSLDDERNTFHPQLWNEGPPKTHPEREPPNGTTPKTKLDDERLSQVWFAGVHSDVGGGYADDAVSYVPLLWIMAGAEKAGVRFLGPIHDEYRRLSDENGPINDSRAGIGGYYRYNPRRIERLAKAPDAGVKIERVKVSESVFRRIKIGQDGYAPIVIPPEFDVVRIDGGIEPGEQYMNAGRKPGEPAFSPDAYAAEREHVFNIVWWRRIAYFVTLGATLLLAAMPLRWPALPDGACHSEWCFLSDIIGSVSAVVPGFLSAWTDAFSSRPDVFGIIALLIVAGLIAGGMLEVRSRDAMRVIWYSDPATTPPPAGSFPAPVRPGPIGRAIERLRRSRGYVATFRFLTQKALPFMFQLAVFNGAGAVLAQSIFAVRSSWGSICRPTIKPEEVEARRPVKERVPTDALCAATGLELKEAGTYRLTLAIPRDEPWLDAELGARAYGIDPHAPGTGRLLVGVPFRRHLGQPWFKPMMRIGWRGDDAYPLDPKPSLSKEHLDRASEAGPAGCDAGQNNGEPTIAFASEVVARSSGELVIYVNDAIFLPPWTDLFYRNNRGSACLTVEKIVPAP